MQRVFDVERRHVQLANTSSIGILQNQEDAPSGRPFVPRHAPDSRRAKAILFSLLNGLAASPSTMPVPAPKGQVAFGQVALAGWRSVEPVCFMKTEGICSISITSIIHYRQSGTSSGPEHEDIHCLYPLLKRGAAYLHRRNARYTDTVRSSPIEPCNASMKCR